MLHSSNLEKKFWAEAINTAVFVMNRVCPGNMSGETPFQQWYGRKFDINWFKIIGSQVTVHVPKEIRLKLDVKSKIGILVGYGDEVKGYRVYFSENNRLVHRYVICLNANEGLGQEEEQPITLDLNVENENVDDEVTVENENLQNVNQGEAGVDDARNEIQNENSENEELKEEEEVIETIPKDKRGTELRTPTWLQDYDLSFYSALEEPVTMEEALSGDRAEQWKSGIERELNVLEKIKLGLKFLGLVIKR